MLRHCLPIILISEAEKLVVAFVYDEEQNITGWESS